ncbi:MAG: HAD-IA family hydrolase [Ruminococcus sp.]|nr:HAD-IA family hydrolase [Ruminococcus sp.]
MYKLVVFDLDGTLANTLSDLASAVNKALISENLPTHRVEAYNHFVGNGIDNLIKQVVGKNCDEQTCKRVKAFFDAYYLEHLCDHTTAYDGMAKLLEQLDTLKVITAVHSNKPHTFVPEILQTLYPQHKFAIAWGKQNHYERKPSAQALNAMMQKLGVEKDQTLYVGDSDVDVFTAHNAGVKVCGVSWGFRGKAELTNAGADFIADTAEELLDIIVGKYE